MNRLLSSLIGAGLAVLMTGAAKADIFTIQRFVDQSPITHSNSGGAVSVNFTGLGVESPEAESAFPGTSLTLLNYTVTSTAVGVPAAPVTFDDFFELRVLLTDKSYDGDPTHTSYYKGHITGTANGYQDLLKIELTPLGDAEDFYVNATHFTIFNRQATLPPIVNDTRNPGAISAQIVSNVVPEPGSMALLGTGLLPALALLRRRR